MTWRKVEQIGVGVAILLLSCSPDHSTSSQPKAFSTSATARLVPSSGVVFRLGSDDPQAGPEERPGWTRFAHDFWLDTTDVTQQEFQSLTGRNPAPATSSSPSNPVVNVTWFDAVLFCNARSKRDHLDTVYEYVSVSSDSTGSIYDVQGLASHLDRAGWRLPTEAEWEYAARAGTSTAYFWGSIADSSKAVDYAWYQKNSGAVLHSVARLKPNPWGFYDLAGDAMEWVQDWKGSFPEDTVPDYGGQDAPGDVPEVPLKGGASNYGLEHLRPSSRSATYSAYRSARVEYVGFRCARGGFTPTYTSPSGQSVQAPPVSILRANLATFLYAQSARMVFLNRSNGTGVLSWIDFSEATPVVRSLPDVDPVFHPAISLDGQWVAWCTVTVGSMGVSRVKVRRLAVGDTTVLDLGSGAIPRWWTDGADTFLVWGTSAEDNTASGWSSGRTMAQKWSNGNLTGKAQTWASGSYHDGKSGQFLYAGYRRLLQYGTVSGASRTLFTYPQDGKQSGDTSQVCNVSSAPDGSGMSLFLDFGYTGTSTLVGRPYGIHEIAFEADSTGTVKKTFPVAPGKLEWDQLAWSNNSRWAVGIAVEQNGAYQQVHLLDLVTGNIVPILQGKELWMPDLWVGSARTVAVGGSDPDSSGAYAVKVDPAYQGILGDQPLYEFAAKASLYWDVEDSAKVIFLGSSRVRMGLAPSSFKWGRSFNWGVSGNELYGDENIIKDYIIPHSPNLKYIVMDFMPGWFEAYNGYSKGFLTWKATMNSIGYVYDLNHNFWPSPVSQNFLSASRSNRTDFGVAVAPYGEVQMSSGRWSSSPVIYSDSFVNSVTQVETSCYVENMKLLTDLIQSLDQRGIRLLLVNFPVNPAYRNIAFAEEYGPKWPIYDSLLVRMKSLESTYSNYKFYDANLDGKHDYTSSEAFDDTHLSYLGAKKLTPRLDSLITDWSRR